MVWGYALKIVNKNKSFSNTTKDITSLVYSDSVLKVGDSGHFCAVLSHRIT